MLNDPEVVETLKKGFVCFAIDNANNSNTTPRDREWLKPLGGEASTQGMFAFTAGGQFLAGGGGYEAKPVRQMLKTALSKFKPEKAPVTEKVAPGDAMARPPEGGLVLYVTWRLADREKLDPSLTSDYESKLYRNALGVDRLWVRKDEADALTKGAFPDSLRKRMAPHFLKFVVPGKLKTDGIKLESGRLLGALLSETGDRADALGFVEAKDGKVTRFDLVIKGLGMHSGGDQGWLAGLALVPKRVKTPMALGFMLADPADDLSRTLPARGPDLK